MLEANSFPNKSELELLHVTNHAYDKDSKRLKKRLLAVIRSVASRYAVTNKSTDSDSASSTSSVTPRDHLHDEIQETTEEALESFNAALDSARGIQDAIVQPSGALGPNLAALKIGLGYLGKRFGGFLDIEKPQIHFPDYPIDNSDAPFVSPYARVSVGSDDATTTPTADAEPVDRHLQDLYRNNSKHEADRRHPYEEEIATVTAEMRKQVFKEEDTIVFGSLKETPCTFVNTEEELFNIAERLKGVSEIAIDLENHSLRSFQGFTCLIQVSSRREDFVIDTLKLRGSINRALAPVFTDETVVKVFHGAEKDVQWLERDFGIYVVNMFDTGQASRLLKLPSASLAFLLTNYCDLKNVTKKKFQLADWRQRPLPQDMFEYARSDTHYLLYVYDRLRTELSKANLLSDAWERSAKVVRRRHSKSRFDPFQARYLAARHGLGFDPRQIRILEALCKWRDVTAREEDESLTYVAPLHTLFGIAKAGEKARTMSGLMNHGFPMRRVPPLIHKHADEIARMVSDAFDAKLEEDIENVMSTDARQGHQSEGKAEEEGKENRAKGSKSAQKVGIASSLNAQRESTARAEHRVESAHHEDTQLPDAKLKKLSKSAFFDSDSDSDSCSDGEQSAVRNTTRENCNEVHDPQCVSGTKIEDSTRMEVEKSQMRSSEEIRGMDKPKISVSKEGQRTKSVFDLSDSSDGEDEEVGKVGEGKSKAAQITRELQAELADTVTNLKSTAFETELETRERERVETKNREQARLKEEEDQWKAEGDEGMDEQDVTTLGSAKWKDEGKKPRRRAKRSREEHADERPKEPFDYSSAVQKMKVKNSRKQAERSFDPMDRLKNERSKKERREVKRRRRGRGKSMSFMR